MQIIGLSGHLWSETVRTDDEMEYMMWPRLVCTAFSSSSCLLPCLHYARKTLYQSRLSLQCAHSSAPTPLLPQAAQAERGWHKAAWELDYKTNVTFNENTTFADKGAMKADLNEFVNVIAQRDLAKLDALGIEVRIPVACTCACICF